MCVSEREPFLNTICRMWNFLFLFLKSSSVEYWHSINVDVIVVVCLYVCVFSLYFFWLIKWNQIYHHHWCLCVCVCVCVCVLCCDLWSCSIILCLIWHNNNDDHDNGEKKKIVTIIIIWFDYFFFLTFSYSSIHPSIYPSKLTSIFYSYDKRKKRSST